MDYREGRILATNFRYDGTEEEGIVRGYISSEKVDSYDTVFPAEVMKKAMEEFNGKIMVQHDSRSIPVGKVLSWGQEDGKTWVEAKISRETSNGRDAWAAIKEGLLDSFSIGFRWVSYNEDEKTKIRTFSAIDLVEISLVGNPSNPDAKVTDFREDRTLLRKIWDFIKGADIKEENEGERMSNPDLKDLKKEVEEREAKISDLNEEISKRDKLIDEYEEKEFISELRSKGVAEADIEEVFLPVRSKLKEDEDLMNAFLKRYQGAEEQIHTEPSAEDVVRAPKKTKEEELIELRNQYIKTKEKK